MNGVAAKIAQEVAMFLEDDDVDASARKQEAKHKPTWAATDDAATRGNLLSLHGVTELAFVRDPFPTIFTIVPMCEHFVYERCDLACCTAEQTAPSLRLVSIDAACDDRAKNAPGRPLARPSPRA